MPGLRRVSRLATTSRRAIEVIEASTRCRDCGAEYAVERGGLALLLPAARRTPFRDGAIEDLTTHLGLVNVTDPGALLAELRRIVSGRFLAVTTFYPRSDRTNAAEISRLGLERLLYRDSLLHELAANSWTAEVTSACRAPARPTPTGAIIENAVVDALPVGETDVEWAFVEAW